MEDQNSPNIHAIRKYLENPAVRHRVQGDILRAREEVTVTIGRAAELFGFTENQLRDWESKGFLKPRRSKEKSGQRLYALEELDKLALIKELTENGKFSISSIPTAIDDVWHAIFSHTEEQRVELREITPEKGAFPSIDKRVDEENKAEYWHYYISKTLHIVLSLIFEDIPDTIAGIILPLTRKELATPDWDAAKILELGACLIGWRDQDNTFHCFYQEVPSFDYPSDFRVSGLLGEEREPKDATFIVLQRKARIISLPVAVVEAVRRLLKPIYEDISIWLPCFKDGPRDFVYSTTVLRGISSPDSLLNFLANQVIRLGGKTPEEKDLWKFCCILLPSKPDALLQMQTLVVQAQSQRSPHTINNTSVSPDVPTLSLSLRAFQSIHMLFRSPISTEDTAIVYRNLEAPIDSAIAMPIGGENSTPLGVLYVVSEGKEAFDRESQRVLRLMGRVIKELLLIVQVRQQSKERLRDIIAKPRVINQTLAGYDSENKLINDIETLLTVIRATNAPDIKGQTAFISIDIDDLTSVVSGYDGYVSINLSKALGDRIREEIKLLSDENDYRIYHAYSDRFYIRLENMSLQRARETADKLQRALTGNYLVPLVPLSIGRPKVKAELIENVKVRLGVLWYEHEKLYTVLSRYPSKTQIADVRSTVLNFLESSLTIGKQKGGNRIISYYQADPPQFEHGRLDVWIPLGEEI